jgi:hypothetical protein
MLGRTAFNRLRNFAMRNRLDDNGFSPPAGTALGVVRRYAALAELVAIAALAASTILVATVVSVGIARADVGSGVIDQDGSVFAIALVLGVLFIGIGGFAILPQGDRRPRH